MMKDAIYILAGKRTPIGSFGGQYKDISAVALASTCINAALNQSDISPDFIGEVVCGNVLSADQGMGPARQVALNSGISVKSRAYSVNMICGSGMKAVTLAAMSLLRQGSGFAVAAGMENMTRAPFLLSGTKRVSFFHGDQALSDSIFRDGLVDAFHNIPMGETAELLAEKYSISREQQDSFAWQSQQRYFLAKQQGLLTSELAPVYFTDKKGVTHTFTDDEYPRADASLEKLALLKPAFKKEGTVTAGNSSGINDGASAIVIGHENSIQKHNLIPLVEIVDWAETGLDPEFMGVAPYYAIKDLLSKNSLSLHDIDRIEINEAFSAQVLANLSLLEQEYNVDSSHLNSITNVNGGAISLGHPLGASGNRILVSLTYQLTLNNLKYGIAATCIGGGMGVAILLRNPNL